MDRDVVVVVVVVTETQLSGNVADQKTALMISDRGSLQYEIHF